MGANCRKVSEIFLLAAFAASLFVCAAAPAAEGNALLAAPAAANLACAEAPAAENFACAAASAAADACGWAACFAAGERMPKGTSVGGVDVSGLRCGEACAAVAAALKEELSDYSLTVYAGEREYRFAPPEIYWRADIADAVGRALSQGGEQPLCRTLALAREEEALQRICADAYRRSVSARVLFRPADETPITFLPDREGRYLDGAALRAAVEGALARGEREVRVQAVRVPPRRTLAQARASAAPLASYTTYYAESNAGRAHNVALAASRLNGRTLAPGETLSFNACAGARTQKNGYLPAPVIFEGEFVEGVGGGVCQVSTTLYNAALLAGLTVAEYHPHSLAVGYVPPSRDAMVSGAACDLKLKNGTGGVVRIVARAAGGALSVRIYGLKTKVTYAIESEVTERLTPPEPEVREGAEATLRAPKEGIRSAAYLVRREPGRPDVRIRLRRDTYAPVRGIVQRPAESASPPAENGTDPA